MGWSAIWKIILVLLRYGPTVYNLVKEIWALIGRMKAANILGPSEVKMTLHSTKLAMKSPHRHQALTALRDHLKNMERQV